MNVKTGTEMPPPPKPSQNQRRKIRTPTEKQTDEEVPLRRKLPPVGEWNPFVVAKIAAAINEAKKLAGDKGYLGAVSKLDVAKSAGNIAEIKARIGIAVKVNVAPPMTAVALITNQRSPIGN